MPLLPATALGEVLTADGLLAAELTPNRPILGPLISRQSLVLLYGPRGLGKTFVALGMAWTAAAGGQFLAWHAERPHRVLYIDGEMAAVDMKQRLARMGPPPKTLSFLLADLQGMDALDLGEWRGQWALLQALAEKPDGRPDLIVLDNLASLTGIGRDSVDRWGSIQRFLMALRRFGIAVLMVHHANKQGGQRGTSRREDLVDVVLAMRRPYDYLPTLGAHFDVHYEKARGLYGGDVEPFEARLSIDGEGRWQWSWQPLQLCEFDRAVALLRFGLNPAQVARQMGISQARSYRYRQKAETLGLLK